MINDDRNIFFGLLRCSLWNEPCPEVPHDYNWGNIVTMARQQTVLGLVADALRKYPEPCGNIPIKELQVFLMRNIQAHSMLNRKLAQSVTLLDSVGIPSVLLKGQGLASNYPDPLLRQCGDIDLYVGPDNYKAACDLLDASFGKDKHNSESPKHYHMMTDGVTVELHRIAEDLPGLLQNRRFQTWTTDNLQGKELRHITVNGTSVALPPIAYDPVYILNHTWQHFMNGGIGLRQICDWAVYLHTFHGHIDVASLKNTLRRLQLLNVWKAFAYIAVTYLGLPESECPLYTGSMSSKSVRMLDIIMSEGNFGQYDETRHKFVRPAGYAAGKLHSFRITASRFIRLLCIFPMKTLQFFASYFVNGVKNFINGLI